MSDNLSNIPNQNTPSLVFTGEGYITATPDIAKIDIGVQTIGNNLSAIEEENARSSASLLNSIRNLGVNNIVSKEYSINKVYDYDSGGTRIDRGYIIRNILELTVDNIGNIGTIIDAGVSSGANVVENISFQISNYSSYYQDALNLAIMNAYDKAQSVYQLLGREERPVFLNIVEQANRPTTNTSDLKLREGVYITPIEPGETRINASVTVDFI